MIFAVFWSSGFHWDKSYYDGQPCRLRSVRVGGWTDVAISLDVGAGWLACSIRAIWNEVQSVLAAFSGRSIE
jgi:hypothetical protein